MTGLESATRRSPPGAPESAVGTPHPELFELRGVSKTYGATTALRDVSLATHAGEVIGLIGANGAGKSTLTRVFSGVTLPDAGELLHQGRPVGARRLRAFRREPARCPRGVPRAVPLHQPGRLRELLPRTARELPGGPPLEEGLPAHRRSARWTRSSPAPGSTRTRQGRRPQPRAAADGRDRPRGEHARARAPHPRRAHLLLGRRADGQLMAALARLHRPGRVGPLHLPSPGRDCRRRRPHRGHAERRARSGRARTERRRIEPGGADDRRGAGAFRRAESAPSCGTTRYDQVFVRTRGSRPTSSPVSTSICGAASSSASPGWKGAASGSS